MTEDETRTPCAIDRRPFWPPEMPLMKMVPTGVSTACDSPISCISDCTISSLCVRGIFSLQITGYVRPTVLLQPNPERPLPRGVPTQPMNDVGQKTCNIGLYVSAPRCPQKSQLPQNMKCLTPIGILRDVVALVRRGLQGGHLQL